MYLKHSYGIRSVHLGLGTVPVRAETEQVFSPVQVPVRVGTVLSALPLLDLRRAHAARTKHIRFPKQAVREGILT